MKSLLNDPNIILPNISDILTEIAKVAPSWTEANERQYLYLLAGTVKSGGLIVEIGCLYGGATAVLCKGAPDANIVSIDEFSWHPEGYGQASPERVMQNMQTLGIANNSIIVGDSRLEGPKWNKEIDFLWIDGGHSYEFIKSDLLHFSPYARLIACHDYGNPHWASVNQAIDEFLVEQGEFWEKSEVVGTVVVLRWKGAGQTKVKTK